MAKQRPKFYEQKIPRLWWLSHWRYVFYMVREITGFFALVYAFTYVYQVYQLYLSKESYDNLVFLMLSKEYSLISFIFLGFMIFHSITWFIAMSNVKTGKLRLSKSTVMTGWLIMWVVSSLTIYYLIYT